MSFHWKQKEAKKETDMNCERMQYPVYTHVLSNGTYMYVRELCLSGLIVCPMLSSKAR